MIGCVLGLSKAELLQRTVSATTSLEDSQEFDRPKESPLEQEGAETRDGSRTCRVCNVGGSAEDKGFADVVEQRAHFKTDWHRYNLHRCSLHRPPVSREEFEALLEREDVSSISGSESESEEDAQSKEEKKDEKGMVCFMLESGSSFRVWKCLVTSEKHGEMDRARLCEAFQKLAELQNWAVLLAKGGHFAAACFEKILQPKTGGKGPLYRIKKHKTLHRYVVRAKAGGRQSTKDASGKHARSVGASLRRHHEAALERDIAEILNSWREDLGNCDLVFHAVSMSDMRAVFGGASSPLDATDSRCRKIPFPTRRPTFSEAKRVSDLLMAMYEAPRETSESFVRDRQIPSTMASVHAAPEAVSQEVSGQQQEVSEGHAVNVAGDNTTATGKTSKKKSRRKAKGKDQRRREASQPAESSDVLEKESKEPDDEVERAIAEAAQHAQRTLRSKKTQTTQKKPSARNDTSGRESAEERRELLRKAAEKRMEALQGAAKNQQLW